MIAFYAGMKRINNELRRTQNELMPPLATNPTNSNELTSPEFVSFRTSSLLFSGSFMSRRFIADFAVHDPFHRKERKGRQDSLNVLYAINHREHREKWQSIMIPVTAYETATASRYRTRMTRVGRIFTDIIDRCASLFHSPDNKPQRSQRTQSIIENLCALRVLCGVTLFTAWMTRIYTYPCASVSSVRSVFHSVPSALTYVHPERLISFSLGDRAQKIRGGL